MLKHWIRGTVAVLLGVALLAAGEAAVAQDAQTKALLEKYRSDFNAAKKETINEVMKLSDAEAQKFWPIYQEYESKLNAFSDKRLKFANDFTIAQSATTFDPDQAKDLTKRWFNMSGPRKRAFGSVGLAVVLAALTLATAAADPLPSWNDCPAKLAIVAFVGKVTNEGSRDFVPAPERIATFDNDGTLWSEQPMYFQFFFAVDRVKALAPQHPEWKTTEPFKSVLAGDMGVIVGGAFWGGCNWGNSDIDIDVNRYNDFNRNEINNRDRQNGDRAGDRAGDRSANRAGDRGNSKWQHNADHRKGVEYRDAKNQQKFGGERNRQAVQARESYRGRAEQGRQQMAREGVGNQRDLAGNRLDGGGRDAAGTRDVGGQSRDRGGGQSRDLGGQSKRGGQGSSSRSRSPDAFNGVGGGASTRASSSRGAASRGGGGMSRGGGGRR